ncbi:MogA/MoaB family molybdenum cofactor biosynthesis protein [Leptolyngbya cf. ectocarpi LEGE 11479]|uniref:Molybdenum cofactor biosynthesis protein B n=1 Tax=Leptolyngbya cf. ectocarpi LEGE 11479 TaxID=1828722 RepID=A0A929FCF5_LEPEC|nr:MogA/MoaB family molybdenum cofactor biosynthesis protein [Leptolyngbya ectocarpi]MBE9069939.1 MogA/MoaB family molybdenum cofactor biosynthesis protein [Leptolyngbya cf. ectocarpi LEGE 11479]
MAIPHPDSDFLSVVCGVITVSDTRTVDTDKSGQLIKSKLRAAGHRLEAYRLVKDEPDQISGLVQRLVSTVDVIICNGGTGIAPRDTTYDAIATLLDKEIPGFGEIFRQLSYAEIGARAMASRATAGVYKSTLLFLLPGSSNAAALAMEALILPELQHLVRQMKG